MSQTEPDEDNRYGEGSPFVRLLETPGRVRILDVFLRKHHTDLSPGDISELVSESTFSRNKDVLLELGIIRESRSEGGKQYYELDLESELVQLLGQFHTQLIEHSDEIRSGTRSVEHGYVGEVLSTFATDSSNGGESESGLTDERKDLLDALGYTGSDNKT